MKCSYFPRKWDLSSIEQFSLQLISLGRFVESNFLSPENLISCWIQIFQATMGESEACFRVEATYGCANAAEGETRTNDATRPRAK